MRLLVIFLIFILSSCANFQEKPQDKLLGVWQLTEASRDEEPTETLESLYLHFISDSIVDTNLSGEPQKIGYEMFKKEKIKLNLPQPLDLSIVELSDSVLQLQASISQHEFQFFFKKDMK
ncbi:MAG: hypothetical protein ABIV51_09735 [Saprospiraceae bacterium]